MIGRTFGLVSALGWSVHNVNAYSCSSDLKAECDRNGYICSTGNKNYPFPNEMIDRLDFFKGTSQYCVCNEGLAKPGGKLGMTGTLCDTMFRKCPDNTVCFHGAPCHKGSDDNYFCDCSKTSYPYDKTFTGENCEYAVTTFCEYPDVKYDLSANGKWMCANGGSCRSTADFITIKLDITDLCDCPKGFDGHHCEFKGNAPICNAECENGGVCKIGAKNYDSLSPALQEYYEKFAGFDAHCICPEGFTGQLCETSTSTCGSTKCLNGAGCGTAEKFGDDTYYECKCGEAKKKKKLTDPNAGGNHTKDVLDTKYAGNFCESASTVFCSAPDGYDLTEFWCTNGGKCPENHWEECKCSADFSGPRCEFLAQHHEGCDLKCENGGTCFHGDGVSNMNDYCKCADGFGGPLCESPKQVCGIFQHHCLNGGVCVEDGDDYTCDCSADTSRNVAGTSCQYAATVSCTAGGGESFCTNQGKCKKIVEYGVKHPGCDCYNGFHGQFCELAKGEKHRRKPSIVKEIIWLYLLYILLAGSIFLIGVYLVSRRRRREKQAANAHVPVATVPEEEILHDVVIT